MAKTLTFALMDAPFESARSTTALRLIAIAVKRGLNVNVFAYEGAVDLPFATSEAPAPLREAFAELRETLRPLTGDDDLETLAETFWSGLHGLHTLMRNRRLRPDDHQRRLALLIKRFSS